MSDTDPAVAAAERQMEKQFGRPWSEPSYQLRVRIAAAREALAPIRELHKPYLPDGESVRECSHCLDAQGWNADWPCDTARLVYAPGEL